MRRLRCFHSDKKGAGGTRWRRRLKEEARGRFYSLFLHQEEERKGVPSEPTFVITKRGGCYGLGKKKGRKGKSSCPFDFKKEEKKKSPYPSFPQRRGEIVIASEKNGSQRGFDAKGG